MGEKRVINGWNQINEWLNKEVEEVKRIWFKIISALIIIQRKRRQKKRERKGL